MIAIGGLLLLQRVGLSSPALIPLLAAAGVGVVWQQADEAQRARWRTAGGTRRTRLLAVVGRAVLLAVGLVGFVATIGETSQAREGLPSTFDVVLVLAVLTGPWWLRMTSDLRAEVSDAVEDVNGVIRGGARGDVTKSISAFELVSGKTVETHVWSVLRKLQLSNRRELSRWAADRRLV